MRKIDKKDLDFYKWEDKFDKNPIKKIKKHKVET